MGFFNRKKKIEAGLEKTRTGFFANIVNTLTGAEINDDLYNDLEEELILADVGPDCSIRLVDDVMAGDDRIIGLAASRAPELETPAPSDLYPVGTVAVVIRVFLSVRSA